MTDAYIYDAIRSPRGRGRPDGSLHEVTSVALSARVLNALKDRNGLEGHAVEDVIWGNVTQVGEQGGCLARSAVLLSDLCLVWAEQMMRDSGVEPEALDRAWPHYDAMRVELAVGQCADVANDAGAFPDLDTDEDLFRAAGHFGRHHRDRIRFQPRRRRCAGRGQPEPRRRRLGRGAL